MVTCSQSYGLAVVSEAEKRKAESDLPSSDPRCGEIGDDKP